MGDNGIPDLVDKLLKLVFSKYTDYGGKGTFLIVILGLAAHHWNVIQLQNVPFPYFVDGLWVYLIVNLSVVMSVSIFEHRRRESGKYCPKCNAQLEVDLNYICPNCGKVRFEKE
jgi:hypothetical protein